MNDEPKKELTPDRLISRHRAALMGFCILWIVFYHSSIVPHTAIVRYFKGTAYPALDMFLFVSGMGTFNSLAQHSVPTFYRHRLQKLVPIWWSYFLVRLVVGRLRFGLGYTLQEAVGFLTFTGYWVPYPNCANWYLYAIAFFYLIAPGLYGVMRGSRSPLKTSVILMLGVWAVSIPFIGHHGLQVFSRLPVFLLGMLFSAYFKDRQPPKVITAVSCLLGLGIIFAMERHVQLHPEDYLPMVDRGFFWYPIILCSPPLAWYLCRLFDWIGRTPLRIVNRVLDKTGLAALEILLATDYLFEGTFDWNDGGKISFLLMAGAIAVGFVYHFVIEKFRIFWRKLVRPRVSEEAP